MTCNSTEAHLAAAAAASSNVKLTDPEADARRAVQEMKEYPKKRLG